MYFYGNRQHQPHAFVNKLKKNYKKVKKVTVTYLLFFGKIKH